MARNYTITQDGESRTYTIEDGIGPQGAAGLDGASSSLWRYKAKTTITSGYPGNGHVIWNNATQASATNLIISHLTSDDLDVELILGFIEVGNKIFLQDSDDSGQNQVWKVSGTPTITGANTSTAYYTFPVTLESSAGTAFDNNESLLVGLGQAVPHHASTHASNGSDPITPVSIGAATSAQGALADSAVQPGDLATVATTGAYADLSGKPTLGNSAALNVGTTAGTVAAGDDARLSDARTPLSHTHGNISNGGAIGSTANLPIITTTSGVLTTGSFGTTANTFTQGNDSRLSDERVPTSAGLTTKFGTAKATPVDADKVAILDSAASDAPKHSTLTAIWTWIQSKFAGASSKTTPIDADSFNIVDSADSNAAKRVTGTNLKAYLKTYLDTLYVALTGNQTVAGNKTFSGQTELTGQAATNSTSAMTRGLVESARKLRTNEKVYGCYSATASGGGASAGANTYGLGYSQLIAGTATSSYAYGYYALEPTNNGFASGTGTNFGANWELTGSFRHSASDNHEGIFRLGVAVLSDATNLANANAFSSIGIGFEFGRISTNINRARIIYHDGSTYKTSAWVTVYTGDPLQREFGYRLHNNGSGTITLYMTVSGSNNAGSPTMLNISSLVSVTDGPTGVSANSSGIYWSAVNSSAAYTIGLGRLSPSPILMTF